MLRHPRLIRAMQWQGCLSTTEALSAIHAHRNGDGRYGGSEAIVHYGGATKLISDAIRNRRFARKLSPDVPFQALGIIYQEV